MAAERKRIAGELVANEIAWVARMLTGTNLDVERINPYTPPERAKQLADMEKRNKWRAMRAVISSVIAGKEPLKPDAAELEKRNGWRAVRATVQAIADKES